MKLLCVYDPAIIFPIPYDWETVMSAREVFDEHDKAQKFFGFKVAITELMQLALASVPDGTPATAGGMAIALLTYLTGPERDRRFQFVSIDSTAPKFMPQGNVLSPHSSDPDIQQIYEDLLYLLGWCQQNHPRKACLACYKVDQNDNIVNILVGNMGNPVPIVRGCYDWGEVYRLLREYPANLLPNIFISVSIDKCIFAFYPPEDFAEDSQELLRSRLPERPGWREVGGNPRGYEDRWGNFWMWNQNRGHWDVQITEQMQRTIGSHDYHLNVECAGKRAPGDDSPLEGHIIEGYKPQPQALHRFSIYHPA